MQSKAKWLGLLAIVLASAGLLTVVLRSANASHFSVGTWAHAVNACTIDESDASEYAVGNNSLSHRSGIAGTITARCNVENLPVSPSGDVTALSMVYRDPDGSGTAYRAIARLRAISNTGSVVTIATVDSNTGPASASFQNRASTFSGHDFHFITNAYYVEVTVSRSNTLQAPAAAIVRIVGIVQ